MNKIPFFVFFSGLCLKLAIAAGADPILKVDTLLSPDSLKTELHSGSMSEKSTLIISTEPSEAIVLLNDSVQGVSPVIISGVDTGVHIITLKKKGCYLKKVELRIDSIQKKELHFVLQQPSRIHVITEPSGATVYLNQKSVGKSPFSINQLKPGDYVISVDMENYESIKQNHLLESNVSDTIRFTLKHSAAYLDSIRVSEIHAQKHHKRFTGILTGVAFALFGLILLIIEAKE